MQARIAPLDLAAEFYTDEGCYIIELLNDAGDPTVSVARARVSPGMCTRWHWLENTVERYVISAGSGEVEVGDLPPAAVSVGDAVLIPAGCRQRIRNTGSTDLVFMAICSPRFEAGNYRDGQD